MTDLKELRAKMREASKLATPGQWDFERISWEDGNFSYEINDKSRLLAIHESNYQKRTMAKRDSDHITLANPENIIALLDRLDHYENILKIITHFGDGTPDDVGDGRVLREIARVALK